MNNIIALKTEICADIRRVILLLRRANIIGILGKATALHDLGEAMDNVRRSEYARLTGENRKFVKGQRYTLLAPRANLTLDRNRAPRLLLKANKRIHTAYLLKGSFGQLWEYLREA